MKFTGRSLSAVFIVLLSFSPTLGQESKQITPSPVKKTTPEKPKPTRSNPVKPDPSLIPPPPVVSSLDEEIKLTPAREPSPYQLASSRRGSVLRLASVPNMFGDLLTPFGQLTARPVEGEKQTVTTGIPLAGGGRRTPIAENNKPIPMDRFYFNYNHYHNALVTTPNGIGGPTATTSLDRYLIGFEKTFFDGLCSIDVRIPIVGGMNISGTDLSVRGGQAGNLNLVLKGLLWSDENTAIGAGVSFDTPTGSDVVMEYSGTRNTIYNDAVFISPFIGFLCETNSNWFAEGILQIDIPLCGNRIGYEYSGSSMISPDKWNDQTLLQVDLTAGYWLCRNPEKPILTGLAAILELHVITTTTDADTISQNISNNIFLYDMPTNRFTMVHLTTGLHANIGQNTTFRVGGVFPLQKQAYRAFDAEVMASINRYF